VSLYVCRDHHSQPVNWRGRGCQRCDRERRQARTQHRQQYESGVELLEPMTDEPLTATEN